MIYVKYWVRVLYTYCDVTQTWFKYLRGIINGFTEFITNRVLYPPIIHLKSTAYTYLTLGSWERDTGAPSALTDRVENRKRKTFPFSFLKLLNRFCYPWRWKTRDFPIVFGISHNKPGSSPCSCSVEEEIAFFRTIAFFVFDMCGWYCFPKNKFVPLACAPRPLPRQTAPLSPLHHSDYFGVFIVCRCQ